MPGTEGSISTSRALSASSATEAKQSQTPHPTELCTPKPAHPDDRREDAASVARHAMQRAMACGEERWRRSWEGRKMRRHRERLRPFPTHGWPAEQPARSLTASESVLRCWKASPPSTKPESTADVVSPAMLPPSAPRGGGARRRRAPEPEAGGAGPGWRRGAGPKPRYGRGLARGGAGPEWKCEPNRERGGA